MKKTSLTFTLLVVVFIILACAYFSKKISAAKAEAEKQAAGPRSTTVTVRTEQVKTGSVKNVLTFNGDIEALYSVNLQSKVAGRLAALALEDGTPVEEGTRVKKGQLIASLDDREYHAKLASATAALAAAEATLEQRKAAILSAQAATASAKANLDDKQREYNRAAGLLKQQAGTQQSLDQAQAAQEQAQANYQKALADESAAQAQLSGAEASIKQAQAQKEEAELDYAETRIYAPMDGVVSKKHLDPGVQVTASTPLVTILSIDTVKVLVSIPVNRLALVKPGQTQAFLRSNANTTDRFACVVEKIYPSVDPVTRTAQVELRLENHQNADGTYLFLPGMYASVDLLLQERENVVTVDVSLPIRNVDKQLIFVCEGDIVHAVPVTLGLTTGGQVEILEGLKAGDEIVVQGQHRLTDGSTITRIEE